MMRLKKSKRNGWTAFSFLVFLLSHASLSQSHPSGWSQRVLVLVQNPTGFDAYQNSIIAPQYSLQILNAAYATGNVPTLPYYWPYIHGWGSATPSSIENLAAQKTGAVMNDDGSLSIINYATETVKTQNVGFTSPSAGSMVTQDLTLAIAANKQAGALNIVPLTGSTSTPITINLPGVSGVSVSPGTSVALVFADDSNIVYMLRKLNQADQQAYSGGNQPAGWVCGPTYLPQYCIVPVTPPGVSVSTFSNQYFDHPFKAVFSNDGSSAFILSGGPEADGVYAEVTVLPIGPLLIGDGGQVGTIPTSPTYYRVPGGVDDGIEIGSVLYLAGQAPVKAGLWSGQLTTINFGVSPVVQSNPMPMADGRPVRMAAADNNTLWIGSIRCNTGANAYYTATGVTTQGGCLTVVDTNSMSVAYVEPYLCLIESATACNTGETPTTAGGTGGSGDVTGIAPIPGAGLVYYVELGQVHVRSTVRQTSPPYGYPDVGTNGTGGGIYNNVTISGTAVDIVYIDSTANVDGTATSTTH